MFLYYYCLLVALLSSGTITINGQEQKECLKKYYGSDKIVCVCNSDHCDTVPKFENPTTGQYLKYTSNQEGLRFNKQTGSFANIKDENTRRESWFSSFIPNFNQEIKITVKHDETYQTIVGFGGAFTDATGINIKSLSEAAQENLMRSYFSDDGIKYSLCRIPIGGTDFSTHGYSYDDNDGNVDLNLTNFNLASEDYDYKLPFIKRALSLAGNNDSLQFIASVWTAPKWMKTNGEYSGVGGIKREMYQTWADYFVRFFQEYEKNGVKFWGVTTSNEPSLSILPISKINSIAWSYQDLSTWVSEHLGPTIKNSEYSYLKIFALDDQIFFLPWYIKGLFSNDVTERYIDGIAIHWYYNRIFSYGGLTEIQKSYPDKIFLATEACKGDKFYEPKVIIGSWQRGEDYADDIIQDVNNHISSWIDWNMALDLTGGPTYIGNNVDSPILVNASSGEFYKQPMYYALGHFSKFVPRNSQRIYSSSTDSHVGAAAFTTPSGNTVLVILNKYEGDQKVSIGDDLKGTIDLSLTGKSITTLVY